MQIHGYLKESFIDYPGKISSVIFTPDCNYSCSSCHAKEILRSGQKISEKEFFQYLDSHKNWIDAIVLCGGEPTLEKGLVKFIEELKQKKLFVKLDTNGSNPDLLKILNQKKLIDYVAMDVKGPASLYNKITQKNVNIKNIEESIKQVPQFPDYEFRTTIVPIIRENTINFMAVKEATDIAKWIVKRTGNENHKYFLQPFVPRENQLLDKRLENFPETPKELLNKCLEEIKKYLPNTRIRW